MEEKKKNKPNHLIKSATELRLSHGARISELEEKILKYWQEKRIFEKSLRRGSGRAAKDYVFYDGPPFATGLPHYGHILASIIKDVVPRYQTMKGRRVERLWGWDCHGLPVENLIEQNLGLKTKKDIEKYGIEKFNEAARESVLEYVDDWKKIIPRIGRWVDMDNAYKTMDPDYTESVWWIFKTLFNKKLVYEGYKSMHICPRCETTLSNFEVAQGYKEIEDSSIVVKFEILNPKFETNSKSKNPKSKTPTHLLAWTTTPWTLPGNVALAVNPNTAYVLTSSKQQAANNKENYILAKERLSGLGGEYEVVKEFNGKELIGKNYEPLFSYYAKDRNLENYENGWKIYGADFVKTDEGTGIVHTAPAFGEDDMNLGRKHNLPFVQHVSMDGKFKKEVEDFEGLPVKPKESHQSTDKKIIDWLAKNNKLFKTETIVHSYPHCWRCDTPLLNYAASSWFVKVTAIKKDLLKNNKKINWVPGHIRDGRFGKGLEDAPDWAISRSRYWGAPLPVWQCQPGKIQNEKLKVKNSCGKQVVIGSVEDLKNNIKKSGNRYFLMRHGESEANLKRVSSSNLSTSRKHHLTLRGREDTVQSAKKLMRSLADQKIDIILSSDLTRVKETAIAAAETIGFAKQKIIFDKRLREVNVGIFDGKNYEKYRSYVSLEKKFQVNPPKGENLTEVKNRVSDFLYEIDLKYKNKNVLIISHEYPLWLMMAGAMGADIKKSVEIKRGREAKNKEGDFLSPAEIVPLDFSPLPHNQDFELDLHRPHIDQVKLKCDCGGEMNRVDYVFDCWFESGAMPYGQSHYPFANKKKFERNFPAEFIAEGLDQTRGWFYTLLVLSTALFKKPAFKNVLVNGIILAESGEKMSKKLRNYPDPMEVIGKYGADALRYYLLSSPVVRAEDLNFSEKGVDEVYKKVILRLINVYSFYEMYRGNSKFKMDPPGIRQRRKQNSKLKSLNVLDKWILVRLRQLISEVSGAMDSYELDRAARPIAEFIDDLSTWYIRRSRERFKNESGDQKMAIATTRFILAEFSKTAAPFLPFLAEWLYLRLDNKKTESVHLEPWPKSELRLEKEDLKIIEDMKLARRFASLGLEARARVGIKVRQPLRELRIKSDALKDKKELLGVIEDEVNVKSVVFHKGIRNEVELDTRITPVLKDEGIVREFARMVQGLRQEAGYKPKDKIYLWLQIPKEAENAIAKNLDEFKSRVGAESAEFRRVKRFDAETETEVDSQKIWIGIKKV